MPPSGSTVSVPPVTHLAVERRCATILRFDAVFLHGVLEHLQDPVAALVEARRVLRDGGLAGVRHADFGGFLLEPAAPPLDRFATLFERLMSRTSTLGGPQRQ